MSTLTSANSALSLQITDLYPVPQAIQGYATDDMFSVADIATAEVLMGVDGKLSGGYTPVPKVFEIGLQADSPSNEIFEIWMNAQDAKTDLYIANATILLRSTGRSYALTRGILTMASPMPAAKKILQLRKFQITFESISSAVV